MDEKRERILIYAHDPGEKHYGFSVLEAWCSASGKIVNVNVLECGQLKYPLDKIAKETQMQVINFLDEQTLIFSKHGRPDVYAVERFSNRGRVGGALNEKVSISIGLMFALMQKVNPMAHIYPITASTWKNAANKVFSLDSAYKVIGTELHELDASLIGVYAACKYYGVTPFTPLSTRAARAGLQQQVESTTNGRRVKRRVKK